MKRILLLVTVALMLAAAMALSGVAQAAPISDKADAQCLKLAIKTLGPSFNPATYNFLGGTDGTDTLPAGTAGPDVFCGFGGDDRIARLNVGDIFLGGEGDDCRLRRRRPVIFNYGTFYGGEGNDTVAYNRGTFYGGPGQFDTVGYNYAGATFEGRRRSRLQRRHLQRRPGRRL